MNWLGIAVEELRELLHHGTAQLLGVDKRKGSAIVTRDVVPDTYSQKLNWAARFDDFNNITKVAFYVIPRINGEGGIINWSTITNDHQYATLFRSREESLVRPK